MKVTVFGRANNLPKEKIEAYILLSKAFHYYTKRVIKQKRGLSADEIVRAVGSYAVHEYGMLATTVLKELSLNYAKDIGAVVHELLSINWLGLDPGDEISDFSAPALEKKYQKFLDGKFSILIQ